PVLAAGEIFGASVAGAVAPAGVSVLVGAFVFGVGMQIAGGCGSGMLYHLGAGVTPMLATLVGFVAGAVLATFHMPFWWATPSLGDVSLAESLGWTGAVVLQLAACALLALVSWTVERRRVDARSSLPVPVTGWRRVARGPWPLGGRFAPRRRVPARRVAAAVLGGLLLGYGSRIAYGCNIGALFGGIASTSLHGWLWAGAALAGTPLGVRLRGLFWAERAAPAG